MKHLPGFSIRYSNVFDKAYLRDWLEPSTLLWFPMSNEKELDDALRVWISFSRFSASLTAMINHVPCGIATLFLMPYRKVRHHCVCKIIVDPKLRRRGIGTALMNELFRLAKTSFQLEILHAEIFEGNPSLFLFQKMGFESFVKQDDYVKLEDGRYMARLLLEKLL